MRSATTASSRALARVKSYLDYGAFTPIQVAATAALNGPEDCIREMRDTYRKRRDALVGIVRPRRLGYSAAGGLDVRLGAVAGKNSAMFGSMQFATLMVEKSGVVVSPGVALRRAW